MTIRGKKYQTLQEVERNREKFYGILCSTTLLSLKNVV